MNTPTYSCQECQTPCFTFFEKTGVCPREIGLQTPQEYAEYLRQFRAQKKGKPGDILIDNSDCCPMFEPP